MVTSRSFRDLREITPEWLTDRLRQNGHLRRGEVTSVHVQAQHKHHLALEVTYSSTSPESLPRQVILKWYKHPDGVREGLFYREIVPAMASPPVPRCYDVAVDDAIGQTHILLEDLSATHCRAPFDLTRVPFDDVVDSYLAFHTHWWDHPRSSEPIFTEPRGIGVAHEATTLEAIGANQRHFAERILPRRTQEWGDRFRTHWQELCAKVITVWGSRFAQRIAEGKNLTLIQGDAQLGNLLLPCDPQAHRLVLIDWEGCVRGIGLWDVARMLIAAELPHRRRQALETALLPRYHARLLASGIQDYSLGDCREDYRLSVLSNIPHALVWETPSYLESALEACKDWGCEELLD